MNPAMAYNIDKGILLEKSGVTLPWKVSFDELTKLGHSVSKHEYGRTYLTWKNEQILGGLNVDLIVMHQGGLININTKLEYVSAYLDEETLQVTKSRFDKEFGPSKFKESGNEYKYTWKFKNCSVILAQKDRFGFYYEIELKHQTNWFDVLM